MINDNIIVVIINKNNKNNNNDNNKSVVRQSYDFIGRGRVTRHLSDGRRLCVFRVALVLCAVPAVVLFVRNERGQIVERYVARLAVFCRHAGPLVAAGGGLHLQLRCVRRRRRRRELLLRRVVRRSGRQFVLLLTIAARDRFFRRRRRGYAVDRFLLDDHQFLWLVVHYDDGGRGRQ